MQIAAVLLCLGYKGVDDYFGNFGYIAEGARFIEQAKDLTLSSGPSEWTVLVVWRVAGPFSQALFVLGRAEAGRVVLVCEAEQVGGDGALVRLLQTGKTEGAGLECS